MPRTAVDVPTLVRQVQDQDSNAWQVLAESVRSGLYCIANTLHRRTPCYLTNADELVHDAEAALWEHLRTCPQPPKDQAELCDLAAKLLHRCLDTQRAENRRQRKIVAALGESLRRAKGTPHTSVAAAAASAADIHEPMHSASCQHTSPGHEANLPSLISDTAWAVIEPALQSFWPPKRNGRPTACWRRCLEGVLFRLLSGIRWRELPGKFGRPSTVHYWYRRWVDGGVLDAIWPQLEKHCPAAKACEGAWHQDKRGARTTHSSRPTRRASLARRRQGARRRSARHPRKPREAGVLPCGPCVIASVHLAARVPVPFAWQVIVCCRSQAGALAHQDD